MNERDQLIDNLRFGPMAGYATGLAEEDRMRLCGRIADEILSAGFSTGNPVSIPTKPGMVNFRVEIVPHLWHTDGTGYCSGEGTPAEVAERLREYADQAESFTTVAPSGG